MKLLIITLIVLAIAYCLDRSQEPEASLMWVAGASVFTFFGVGLLFA